MTEQHDTEAATIFYRGWVIQVRPMNGHWEWDAFVPGFEPQAEQPDKDAALVEAMEAVDDNIDRLAEEVVTP